MKMGVLRCSSKRSACAQQTTGWCAPIRGPVWCIWLTVTKW